MSFAFENQKIQVFKVSFCNLLTKLLETKLHKNLSMCTCYPSKTWLSLPTSLPLNSWTLIIAIQKLQKHPNFPLLTLPTVPSFSHINYLAKFQRKYYDLSLIIIQSSCNTLKIVQKSFLVGRSSQSEL